MYACGAGDLPRKGAVEFGLKESIGILRQLSGKNINSLQDNHAESIMICDKL